MTSVPTTVFLDRDGVISQQLPEGEYVTAPEQLTILPGSVEAISRLTAAGILVFVVTNQQGVGKGLMTLEDLDAVNSRLLELVAKGGGTIKEVLSCPHLEGTCDCRKPAPGLFLEAQRRTPSVSFIEAVVIGDSESDMEAARRIGAQGIKIGADLDADARDLNEAVAGLLPA